MQSSRWLTWIGGHSRGLPLLAHPVELARLHGTHLEDVAIHEQSGSQNADACAATAGQSGLSCWLYAPSLACEAAAQVVRSHPLPMLSLRRDPGHLFEWQDGLVAAFAVDLDRLAVHHALPLSALSSRAAFEQRTVITFQVEPAEPQTEPEVQAPFDWSSEEALGEFCALVEEGAARRLSSLRGQWAGVITDLPRRGPLMSGYGMANHNGAAMVPWPVDLAARYAAAHATSLPDHLPDLFLRPGGRPLHPSKWRYAAILEEAYRDAGQRVISLCQPAGVRFVKTPSTLTAQVAAHGAYGSSLSDGAQGPRRLLALSGAESLWAQVVVGWADGLQPANSAAIGVQTNHEQLTRWIADAGWAVHWVEDGDLAAASLQQGSGLSAWLMLNGMRYEALVAPPLVTLRSSSLAVACELARAGGQVVFSEPLPALVDGLPSVQARLQLQRYATPFEPTALTAALAVGESG